ncbi:accessory Sec system translocase SecA2 [Thermodesulfobacteriota bacterium]
MMRDTFFPRLKRFHQRINGSAVKYDLTPYFRILDEIKKHESNLKKKTDCQLKQISQELTVQAQKDMSLDDLLVKAYALVCEAVYRVLGLRPFDVQIIGAIVMHQGELAEMQTGEGKTLSAVFPSYLNALTGRGVHVLTFNDYLAHRDAKWMGPVYQFLSLTTGYVQEGMSSAERRKAYSSDITYLSAKEAGFDFLRDSLCDNINDRVHRPFNYAIIDEADSILIDEARIPLVIAGNSDTYISDTYHMATIARELEVNRDLELDESARNIYLTDYGLKRVENLLNCENLHASENTDVLTRLNCAIHAEFLLFRDVDYIVRNNKIELVDEFTGRVADKRRWPDGLQAALEAKENIALHVQGKILNSITLQHFLQRYPKVSGMTATAQSAEEEFKQFYDLDIVAIPPNRPCTRVDYKDVIFKTKKNKNKALINDIIKISQTRRPILVGTRSVKESALLAMDLKKHHIKCNVLNAKRDDDEARIIARAGKLDAVTISTNMAGRGVDIRLGGVDEKEKAEVLALGGLYVVGTNKHESQRIDRQLRGRSGRQGEPGSSRFFISLEDDLFIKFRLQDFLPKHSLGVNQYGEIDNKIAGKEIQRIQRKIEGQNLEIKIALYKYSSIIEIQRELISEERTFFLKSKNALDFFESESPKKFYGYKSLLKHEKLNRLCKRILISSIDAYWSQYLSDIGEIREEIHLYSYGGRVPFFEFQKISGRIFAELSREWNDKVIQTFNNIPISEKNIDIELEKIKTPSATWTYILNDNPMDFVLGVVGGDIGASAARDIAAPIIMLLKRCFVNLW